MDSHTRLWRRAWCMFILDALAGRMDRPDDSEHDVEYWSRAHCRQDIIDLHPDFVMCCENAWGKDVHPDRIRRAFIDGLFTRDVIFDIWRSCGID